MAENNDSSVQTVKIGVIQEVQASNSSIVEGYQPLQFERKGYQPIDTPPPQSPPQSILSSIPVTISPSTTTATSVQVQAPSTTPTDESK